MVKRKFSSDSQRKAVMAKYKYNQVNYITKEDLEKAEMEAILGKYNEKELYRRLKASYATQEKIKKARGVR